MNPRPQGSITADPNPILDANSRGHGSTTLRWTSTGTTEVEVRVDAPDGPVVSRTGPSGQKVTGAWVRNGMRFYLLDACGKGAPAERTLSKIRVAAYPAGVAPPTSLDRLACSVFESVLSSPLMRRIEQYAKTHGGAPRAGKVSLGSLRRVAPISREYGYDRGEPISRHYIERFLAGWAPDVQGHVLEIGEDLYTRRFGTDRVMRSDVLSLEPNPKATIIADLTRADHLPSDTYDCIILVETLHYIFDARTAVRTLHRLLKPGGVLLVTVPGVRHTDDEDYGSLLCWSFTTLSLRRLLAEFFEDTSLDIQSYGNVLAAVAFLYGLSSEELTAQELDAHDHGYDLTVAARAIKQ